MLRKNTHSRHELLSPKCVWETFLVILTLHGTPSWDDYRKMQLCILCIQIQVPKTRFTSIVLKGLWNRVFLQLFEHGSYKRSRDTFRCSNSYSVSFAFSVYFMIPPTWSVQSNRIRNVKTDIVAAEEGRRKDVSRTLENRIARRSVATFCRSLYFTVEL